MRFMDYFKLIWTLPVSFLMRKLYEKVIGLKFLDVHYRRLHQTIKRLEASHVWLEKSKMQCDGFFTSINQEEHEGLIKRAERSKSGIFDIFECLDLDYNQSIKWHVDPRSSYEWPIRDYKKQILIDLENQADVKYPWELSRMHHMVWYGQAYSLTGELKFIDAYKKDFISWYVANPFLKTVHWTCAMEVSIRAINLIVGYSALKDELDKDDVWLSKFNQTLFLHGDFVAHHLERGIVKHNHYFSNVVGLIWLGTYFKESTHPFVKKHARRWLSFGVESFEKEAQNQFKADGFNFEASTYYHAFVTEMMLMTVMMMVENHLKPSDLLHTSLFKACDVLHGLTFEDYLIPLIGDVDSGRLLKLSLNCTQSGDFRHSLGLAAKHINHKQWSEPLRSDLMSDIHLEDSGIHLFRWDGNQVLFKTGGIGTKGYGGHSHNDQLSFVLHVGGQPVFIDPGTGYYSGDRALRNALRSTGAHNTVCVKGIEQNRFDQRQLFLMRSSSETSVLSASPEHIEAMCEVKHHNARYLHTRTMKMHSGTLMIDDLLSSDGRIDSWQYASKRFVLDPGLSIEVISDNEIKLFTSEIEVLILSEKLSLERCMVSSGYGMIRESHCIVGLFSGIHSATRVYMRQLNR